MVSRPLIAQGYSLAEEVANSISHGIGLVFGIVGLVLLLVQAVDTNASAMAITSYSLYGGSMILLFLASTLYHAIPHQRAKIWLKKFDHCAIYLLIAGTYTPFLLVGLNSPLSRGLMIVIWSLALLGILFKLTIAHRFKVLSLVTYLTMGWLSLIVVYQLAIKLAVGGVTLLAVGGVSTRWASFSMSASASLITMPSGTALYLGAACVTSWPFICMWGRCSFYILRPVALTLTLSHSERENTKTVGPVSAAPPGDTASLFQ
ncbi:COG1272: Predicted membrane protein hemolysin III homolog [Enterobacter cloacae]|uniref:COG1272: Predicted membrane protein hemolysin III homolog n=23 Tax=Enterobacteriaceae TaxID=543 RepID=A0A377LTB8_ENTCL|nr:COG1272: Predicted membrane protein hemolysin III homolog [Enterobacter cloacae]